MTHRARAVTVVWGAAGLAEAATAPNCVIVDVLSFSTAVATACQCGALVFPYPWRAPDAADHARALGALLAGRRGTGADHGLTLSPRSLTRMTSGQRLVLPSVNGASLSFESRAACTIAACLRNASAVAGYLGNTSGDVVIAASGERWPDGSLRPALEDYLGAGALVAALDADPTVEAEAARAVFAAFAGRLCAVLRATRSGEELIARGFAADVDFAAELNTCNVVPVLHDGAFHAAAVGQPVSR